MCAERKYQVGLLTAVVVAAVLAAVDASERGESYAFATPLFGLDTARDGSLLVADAGAGVVRLGKHHSELIASLPGVSDVTPSRGGLLATTGGSPDPSQLTPESRKLYRIKDGEVTLFADLWAFEDAVNPDGGIEESNPFDVEALQDGGALVADAAANALLIVDRDGNVDWVATFPREAGIEAVPTSVAIGPDGAYYVGELKGFPGPVGLSKVWRIEPGTRHARCGESNACSVVLDGFTSIIDLTFGPDGTLYVVELDEAGWFAMEIGLGEGGTVNACRYRRRAWSCEVERGGLTMPTAATVDRRGNLHVVINALIPGEAAIITP